MQILFCQFSIPVMQDITLLLLIVFCGNYFFSFIVEQFYDFCASFVMVSNSTSSGLAPYHIDNIKCRRSRRLCRELLQDSCKKAGLIVNTTTGEISPNIGQMIQLGEGGLC